MSDVARLVGNTLLFDCPGCETMHGVGVSGAGAVWTWNGSLSAPTLTPSVLIRTGHYVPHVRELDGDKPAPCWCTWNAEHPDEPAPFKCTVCHSFVRDGQIEYLSDCTHALAGQIVPMLDTRSPPA